jgi:hypothetical protein
MVSSTPSEERRVIATGLAGSEGWGASMERIASGVQLKVAVGWFH